MTEGQILLQPRAKIFCDVAPASATNSAMRGTLIRLEFEAVTWGARAARYGRWRVVWAVSP